MLSSKISAEECPVVLTIRRPLRSLAKVGQGVNCCGSNLFFSGSVALKGRKVLSEQHKIKGDFDLKLQES